MQMVRIIYIALLFSLFVSVNAQVKVEVKPQNPIKGESFSVYFKINTTSDNEPYISFSPQGVEVSGRAYEGVSVQAKMINGKFSTTRELIYRYEMVAPRSGIARLRDIVVEVGGQQLTHPNIRVNVLSQRKASRAMFMLAEVSNTSPYVGEGIDLRYYLYSRYPIVGLEFKKFPKLNGFIKRFHKVPDNEETVEYNGQVYRRYLRYSARIFPKKVGNLYIDSLKMIAQYSSSGGRGNPFGFGSFGFQSMRKREVSSQKLKLNVLALPASNIPKSFQGLVGEHDFTLEASKNKFLVNEAVELRLLVKGEGLLENYPAPTLYQNDYLEEFDTKSEFVELDKRRAQKTFDYTYLAKGPYSGKEKEVLVSYFDPETKRYIEKNVKLPAITIIGTAQPTVGSPKSSNTQKGSKESKGEEGLTPPSGNVIIAPLFNANLWSQAFSRLPLVVYALVIVVFIQLIELFVRRMKNQKGDQSALKLYKQMKKDGFDFSTFHQLIFMKKNEDLSGVSAQELINSSSLSKKEKEYLVSVLHYLEGKNYSDGKKAKRVPFKDAIVKKWVMLEKNETP